MQQDSSAVSFCPSFSLYASVGLADAAVKIAGDSGSGCVVPDLYSVKLDGDWEDDVDFEFVSPKTASLWEDDLVFFPTKPYDDMPKHEENDNVATSYRDTSRNLLLEHWNMPTLSSPSFLSSESDEREIFPASSYYCLWSPIRSSAGGGRSKSKPAGTSSGEPKRWRFRDLLRRSHSNCENGTSVFTDGNDGEKKKKKRSSISDKRKDKTTSRKVAVVAHGDTRRESYLPYRQDLIGVFAAMKRLRH